MEGFLGSKTQYSDQSHSSFQQFFDLFQQSFKLDNPDEDISKPGTYAIQAYDSIISLIQAMERIAIYHISSEKLQERTLGSTFTSLKGEAGFKERLVEFTKPMAEPELSIMIAAEEAPNGIAVEESGRSSMNGKGGDKTEVMAGSEQGLRGLKQVLKGWVLNELLKLLGKSCSLHNESEFFYGTYVDSALPFGELDLPITVPVKPEAPKGIPIEDSQELFLWQDLIRQVPKNWSVLDTKPMKIAIPGKATFEEFVKVEDRENSTQKKYSGFCIDVFSEVLELLKHNHSPRYEFVPYYGTYNDLFDLVIDKTFDGIVGDIPIIANLSKYVDFTPPLFAHSGLSMIVPLKPESTRAWIFLKPFNRDMWLATVASLIYTMFIVWFIEHRSNPEFFGPWKDQLGNVRWFTFSSLFFTQRERIQSNYARVLVVVWLFVVLVLTQSYIATLNSMLSVSGIQPIPNAIDIEQLRSTNATVGYNGDSTVRKYLENVLKFKAENIKTFSSQHDLLAKFKSGNISAAFLEYSHAKAFVNQHCKKYDITGSTYRFGGLGFVFQKGSPIAANVSVAILQLSQNGMLKKLEYKWFSPSQECSKSQSTTSTSSIDRLSLQNFWDLYLISCATSTLCFLLFLIHLLMNPSSISRTVWNMALRLLQCLQSVWNKALKLLQYLQSAWNKALMLLPYWKNRENVSPGRAPTSGRTQHEIELC